MIPETTEAAELRAFEAWFLQEYERKPDYLRLADVGKWVAWQARAAATQVQQEPNIHSCSYYCKRPACVKAQRDDLRDRFVEPRDERAAFETWRLSSGLNMIGEAIIYAEAAWQARAGDRTKQP